MKTIGVLSDTHRQSYDPELAARLAEVFAGVDLILHAGDLTGPVVLDMLPGPEVVAVHGNMCSQAACAELPGRRLVEVEGKRLGLTHGWGSAQGLARRVWEEFRAQKVDAVVFGHSHQPTNLILEGVLLFNPGAVAPWPRRGATVGILIVDQGITGRILDL
ncbi:MAG: metallophosphoesterase [Deltaproteobacteria bacterium]|nr:metallophosphoesterase [Deltaproteobacteria bacterium]